MTVTESTITAAVGAGPRSIDADNVGADGDDADDVDASGIGTDDAERAATSALPPTANTDNIAKPRTADRIYVPPRYLG